MAEYCGTAALANAVVISWSCFPSSSAFEGPSASLRHQPRRPCRVTRHTAGSAGSSHRYIAHTPASIRIGKVARQFLNCLASAQISAVASTRRAFPIFFGGKVCGNGNSETNFFRRATNCPGWVWAAKSAMRASKFAAAPRQTSHRRPSGKWSSFSVLSMTRSNSAKTGLSTAGASYSMLTIKSVIGLCSR